MLQSLQACRVGGTVRVCARSAERIGRLEAENKALKESGMAAATERVTELESQVDDVTRLKDSFEKARWQGVACAPHHPHPNQSPTHSLSPHPRPPPL